MKVCVSLFLLFFSAINASAQTSSLPTSPLSNEEVGIHRFGSLDDVEYTPSVEKHCTSNDDEDSRVDITGSPIEEVEEVVPEIIEETPAAEEEVEIEEQVPEVEEVIPEIIEETPAAEEEVEIEEQVPEVEEVIPEIIEETPAAEEEVEIEEQVPEVEEVIPEIIEETPAAEEEVEIEEQVPEVEEVVPEIIEETPAAEEEVEIEEQVPEVEEAEETVEEEVPEIEETEEVAEGDESIDDSMPPIFNYQFTPIVKFGDEQNSYGLRDRVRIRVHIPPRGGRRSLRGKSTPNGDVLLYAPYGTPSSFEEMEGGFGCSFQGDMVDTEVGDAEVVEVFNAQQVSNVFGASPSVEGRSTMNACDKKPVGGARRFFGNLFFYGPGNDAYTEGRPVAFGLE
ncbi:hypothetical protein BBBOND_0206260 [Babesia bigemina]|uniref:Uncharacterized protein n=1 Tax=Babesia bigemina TaxID=5866 RepID=A0A061D4G1_BABBI|nr:hypothetical protein BBBOND_0206260 [Babesia bigemina]CDR95468.1 hypothetical protein BBBOND_0206260 [Babesia bigemina]|eukprot:XP_012767654.1 hypothetical protein BBBOND_0206260 [Babesia bigemina]